MRTLLLLLVMAIPSSYAGNWEWVRGIGTPPPLPDGEPTQAKPTDIATDAAGNSYVTGYFTRGCFWNGVFLHSKNAKGELEFVPKGGDPIFYKNGFLAKYDSNGNLVWLRQITGELAPETTPQHPNYNPSGESSQIALDKDGNIYICGSFGVGSYSYYGMPGSTADFGNNVVLQHTDTSATIYVAKYDNAGNALWAAKAEIPDPKPIDYLSNDAYAIAVDEQGSCYITGSFYNQIKFGDFILKCDPAYPNNTEIFATKYSTDGKVLWAKQAGSSENPVAAGFGGGGQNVGYGIAASSKQENIYVTGKFYGEKAKFDDLVLSCTANVAQLFVACYDASSGNTKWVRQAQSFGDPDKKGDSAGHAIAVDSGGDCYITGKFRGAQNLDFCFLNAPGEDPDAFVAKCNADGKFVWAKQEGVAFTDYHQSGVKIAVDDATKVAYVVGGYLKGIVLSDGSSADAPLSSWGNTFILGYNYQGSIVLKTRIIAPGLPWAECLPSGIAISGQFPAKKIHVVGSDLSGIFFLHQWNGNNGLTLNLGGGIYRAGFVAKYDDLIQIEPPGEPGPVKISK